MQKVEGHRPRYGVVSWRFVIRAVDRKITRLLLFLFCYSQSSLGLRGIYLILTDTLNSLHHHSQQGKDIKTSCGYLYSFFKTTKLERFLAIIQPLDVYKYKNIKLSAPSQKAKVIFIGFLIAYCMNERTETAVLKGVTLLDHLNHFLCFNSV